MASFFNKQAPPPLKPRSAPVNCPPQPGLDVCLRCSNCTLHASSLNTYGAGGPLLFTLPHLCSRAPTDRKFYLYVLQVSMIPGTISASCFSLFYIETCPVCYNWSLWPLPFSLISWGSSARRREEGRSGKSPASLPQDGCVILCKTQVFYRILSSGFEKVSPLFPSGLGVITVTLPSLPRGTTPLVSIPAFVNKFSSVQFSRSVMSDFL